MIGSIDSVQKIHIRTKYLNEAPLKIRYHKGNCTTNSIEAMEINEITHNQTENSNVFILATQHNSHPLYDSLHSSEKRLSTFASEKNLELEASPMVGDEFLNVRHEAMIEDIQCNLTILNEQTFEVLYGYKFLKNELITSVETVRLSEKHNEGGKEYIVVGTADFDVTETEPSSGRIHVLEWVDDKLTQVGQPRPVDGAVYCMAGIANGKLVAGINSTIVVFNFVNKELQIDAKHYRNGMALISNVFFFVFINLFLHPCLITTLSC